MAGSNSDIKSSGSSTSFSQTTVRAVGYAAIAIVTVVMLARVALHTLRPRKVQAEDYCMVFAYTLFVAQCVLYIILSPIRDRVQDFTEGRTPLYPELAHDGFLVGRLIVPALIFFWFILWTVKFGLLLLYRKLIAGLPGLYTKIWWFLVVFCGIVSSIHQIPHLNGHLLTYRGSPLLATTLHFSRHV
jgi:Ni,Fe-hydrogenase I cytochrome b subunit